MADTQPTFRPDPAVWDRGRRARRRTRVVTGAAVVAVVAVVGGIGASGIRPDAVGPADSEVPEGAIPSRIVDPAEVGVELELEEDRTIGPASVAFVSMAGQVTLIGATDGEYHALDLRDFSPGSDVLALSPDGRRLAWTSGIDTWVVDLTTGAGNSWHRAEDSPVTEFRVLVWSHDSMSLSWRGEKEGKAVYGSHGVAPPSSRVSRHAQWYGNGIPSPDGRIAAFRTTATNTEAVPFRSKSPSDRVMRTLPSEVYPRGAGVVPLGWADDDLVLGDVQARAGSDVEGRHLALFTSPDRPESQWTYRILVRDMRVSTPVSVAVDLIPDLDGTSSPALTHDFPVPGEASPWRERAPYVLGGLLALLAGLAFVRMLRHQA